MTDYRIGVDVGGTFTDIVALRGDGALLSKKVLSTPDDYSCGIDQGLRELFAEAKIDPGKVIEFAHGTTVATNTIIERKGARVGLVTTKGFRDVLELGRFRSPRLYDLDFRKPTPLVERHLRLEVDERTSGRGEVVTPVDDASIDAIAQTFLEHDVEAVAICLINSYINPANELALAALLRTRLPERIAMSASSRILPQIQEYERTSTTVINAYLQPIIQRYVDTLEERLRSLGVNAPLRIMQSSGGVLPGKIAGEFPVFVIESGPAAGVIGAQRFSRTHGLGDLMVLDMGGTTAKASIIIDDDVAVMPECEVGGDAQLGHRLMPGAGYPVQVPTIDIAEVGAGGGSIAASTVAGGLQVGPRSAGAQPGPACYMRGGEEPTLTDANLYLGYLNPGYLVGGEVSLDRSRAESVLSELGARVGLDPTEVAYGIHQIGNATMMRALSSVSSERGRDPAKFGLFAIGGNGALHAGELAETLGISRIVVPPAAGLFSAVGLLSADIEHQLVHAFYRSFSSVNADEVNAALAPMLSQVTQWLSTGGQNAEENRSLEAFLEMKYAGQGSTLGIQLGGTTFTPAMLATLADEFDRRHHDQYGYNSPEEQKRVVAIKVVGRAISGRSRLPERIQRVGAAIIGARSRTVYFGPQQGWLETPVMARDDLAETPRSGPIIVEEYDATTVVRPGWNAARDAGNNLVVERTSDSVAAFHTADATPVRRELFRHALTTIADNMIVTVVRTSRSEVVKSSLDFSSAICDAEGQLIAQGLALPAHLGSMMPALRGCLDRLGNDLKPGDILASNDPYAGASHLNDIYMFQPVFAGTELMAFLCLVVHHTDMGGRVPGGNAADSTEIFQEGLRIPPSKIVTAGEPNGTLLALLEANVRVPDKVLGDVRAQLASLRLASHEFERLLVDFSPSDFRMLSADLLDYTETLTRAAISALPDGRVQFTDWIDDDGVGSNPVKIAVTLTVDGDEIEVSFEGTSPQTSGALNPNFWFTASCSFAAIRSMVDQNVPNNAGLYRPITVTAPSGSFVNPKFPAPVGARGLSGYRVRHAVSGALAMLVPERMPACPGGSEFGIVFAGRGEDDRPFLFLEFHNTTGIGGYPDSDGQDAGPWCLTNVANVPIEIIEAEYPLRIESYSFLPDTGGAGMHRGALGIVREYRLLAEQATVQLRSDRQEHAPWGLAGGMSGAPGHCILRRPTENVALPSKFIVTLTRDDLFRAEMPGSGGHGSPFERDPFAVERDVLMEKVTPGHAREVYAVVIDENGKVDLRATQKLRAGTRKDLTLAQR